MDDLECTERDKCGVGGGGEGLERMPLCWGVVLCHSWRMEIYDPPR